MNIALNWMEFPCHRAPSHCPPKGAAKPSHSNLSPQAQVGNAPNVLSIEGAVWMYVCIRKSENTIHIHAYVHIYIWIPHEACFSASYNDEKYTQGLSIEFFDHLTSSSRRREVLYSCWEGWSPHINKAFAISSLKNLTIDGTTMD